MGFLSINVSCSFGMEPAKIWHWTMNFHGGHHGWKKPCWSGQLLTTENHRWWTDDCKIGFQTWILILLIWPESWHVSTDHQMGGSKNQDWNSTDKNGVRVSNDVDINSMHIQTLYRYTSHMYDCALLCTLENNLPKLANKKRIGPMAG